MEIGILCIKPVLHQPNKIPRPVYKPHSVRQGRFTPRRVSSPPLAWAIIYLGRASPRVSSGLPRARAFRRKPGDEQPPTRHRRILPLLGLAPGGGCLAARIAASAGGLLHRLFTLAVTGSRFLWPGPAGCPAPGVTRHRALWSADFPRPCRSRAAITQPAWGKSILLLFMGEVN